jgi:RHS repeat-associated protein
MDGFTYNYTSLTNKLSYVSDAQTNAGAYSDDIDNGQAAGNYGYDAIGQLTSDASESSTITWNVYKKVTKVTHSSGTKPNLEFLYDPMGNRVCKIVKPQSGGTEDPSSAWTYTYYVHDATGNVMSVYERSTFGTATLLNLKESHIYASARMGFAKRNEDMIISYTAPAAFTRTLGNKEYEHTNHLGNVLVVTSDKKIPVNIVSTTNLDYYVVDVRLTNDYYSFGSLQPGRGVFSSDGYRYKFNGCESDDEVHGSAGTSYAADFRMFDSRLGRWLSIDPIVKPWESPYAGFANNPIVFSDPSGLTPGNTHEKGQVAQQTESGLDADVTTLPELTIYEDPSKYDWYAWTPREIPGNPYTIQTTEQYPCADCGPQYYREKGIFETKSSLEDFSVGFNIKGTPLKVSLAPFKEEVGLGFTSEKTKISYQGSYSMSEGLSGSVGVSAEKTFHAPTQTNGEIPFQLTIKKSSSEENVLYDNNYLIGGENKKVETIYYTDEPYSCLMWDDASQSMKMKSYPGGEKHRLDIVTNEKSVFGR